jgi:hypothetical protein
MVLQGDDDGDGFTESQGDCDDNNSAIYPGAIEICGDGIDQDCNGSDKECSGPKPGHWSGDFSGGKDISFTVSDDSNYVYDFTGEFDCNGSIFGKGKYSFTLTFSKPVMKIENNEFSGNVSTSHDDFHVDGSISVKFIRNDYAKIKFHYIVNVTDIGSDSGYTSSYLWN